VTAGIDQGTVPAPGSEILNLHGQGYLGALGAGAQAILVGFFGTPDGSAAGDGKFIGSQHFVDQVSR